MQTIPRIRIVSRSALTIIAAALAFTRCGSSSGGADTTAPPTPVLTSVVVTLPVQSVLAGGTVQLAATPRDQSGNAISASVSWSSSAPSVAAVSASGLASAIAAGVTTITATATSGTHSVRSSAQLTVTAPLVLTSVSVSAPANTVVAGATLQLASSPKDQNGAAITAAVTYSSSAQGIATVNAQGLVTGVAAGSATITATATSGTTVVTGQLVITVTALPTGPTPVLTSVTINAPTTSVVVGGAIQLTAATKDQNGAAIAATVTWSSGAPGVASVSSTTGQVIGQAAGTATITATATANGVVVSNGVQITVTPPPPVLTSVTISAPASSVAVAGTLQFTATPRDQFGSAIAADITWLSSATSKATISNSGLVTGVAAGTTNITASASLGSVTVGSAASLVTVTGASFPASASVNATLALTFSPNSVDIAAGGQVTWNFATTHNVTFNATPGAPANIGDTSSGSASATFNSVGTFNYQCTIHAGMTGVVVVH